MRIASQYLGWMMRYRKSAEVTVGLNRVMLAFAVFRSELKAGGSKLSEFRSWNALTACMQPAHSPYP